MPQTADAIKGCFGVLKNMKLDLKSVSGWETTMAKYAEFEKCMDAVVEGFPKAKEVANNPNITPGPAFAEFKNNQQKALKAKQEAKPLVEKLEQGRQKLYDEIKKMEKAKGDPYRNKLQSMNTQFNLMLTSVRQTQEELGPLTPSPKATTPPPAPAKPQGNQYAKTPTNVPTPPPKAPNQYAKTPVTKK